MYNLHKLFLVDGQHSTITVFLLAEKWKSLPPITVASQETVLFSLANIVTFLYNVLALLTDRGECHSLHSGFHSNVVCFISRRGWRHFQLTLLCVGRHSLHEAQAFDRERVWVSEYGWMNVCVHASMRACMCACVYAHACLWVHAYVHVFMFEWV